MTSLRHSIFTRLLAVMTGIALAVPLMVGGTFVAVLRPALNRTMDVLFDECADLLATSDLDLEAARRSAERYDIGIRYQGPRGEWTTDEQVPVASGPGRVCGSDCRVVRRPDGGAYVFVSWLQRRAQVLHDRLLLALIGSIVALIFLGHAYLRRALSPLRELREGVASLASGDLEVVVPQRAEDEFGALAGAFNQMVGRVREMVRSRDQLLRDVSHELRSPLTRMRVGLELWEEGEPRRRLQRSVAEMEALVEELLELERLRAGRGVEIATHDLVEVVRDAVLAFGDRAPGVELVEAPASLPLAIDPDKVRSAVNNLLENALRYSLPDSARVQVLVREVAERVEVAVRDDGPGIPEDELEHLFEPFFRVDPSRSRRTGGYGLGLSICQRILEAHQGRVEVRNREPRGAVFTLVFPRAAGIP